MRTAFIFSLLLPLVCLSQGQRNSESSGIHFCKNLGWQKISEQAKAKHKYIFVDCYTTWCGWCKEMDKEVFSTNSVASVTDRFFLSLRLQCDTAKNDDEDVKACYADAHQMLTKFHLKVYPTYLLFSPNGELVHQGTGFLDSAAFILLLKEAIDPNRQYFTLLKNYLEGKKDYVNMPYLAKTASNFGDSAISSAIGRDYIQNYLNRLSGEKIGEKDNLQMLRDFVKELHSDDRSFKWIKEHTELADSVVKQIGFSAGLLSSVVYQEEVRPAVNRAKENDVMPDWSEMTKNLTAKTGFEAAKKALWKGKMDWYRFKMNWEEYYAVVIEAIESAGYKENPGKVSNIIALNQVSFEIFQHSTDKSKLEKALSWMDIVVGNITDSFVYAGSIYDTKAELLYKLERKEEALALEAKAVEVAPKDKTIQELYQKMQEGKPTW
jgi:thioredoxin-related protein